MSHIFLKNQAWTLHHDQDMLVFTAGSDEFYAIEDTPDSLAQPIINEWHKAGKHFSLEAMDAHACNICHQLITAGVLLPVVKIKSKTITIKLIWCGREHQQITHDISNILPENFRINQDAADWALVFRTNTTLADTAKITKDLSIPHLFVDCAAMHTISLGPVVYPSGTTRISDLAARLLYQWGDASPPDEPVILKYSSLIAQLSIMELVEATKQTSSLINSTVAYNFLKHEVVQGSIYSTSQNPDTDRTIFKNTGYARLWHA